MTTSRSGCVAGVASGATGAAPMASDGDAMTTLLAGAGERSTGTGVLPGPIADGFWARATAAGKLSRMKMGMDFMSPQYAHPLSLGECMKGKAAASGGNRCNMVS